MVNTREFVNSMVAECYPDEVKKKDKKKLLTMDEEDKEEPVRLPAKSKRGAEEEEQSQRSRAYKDTSHSAIEMEDIDVQ